MKLYPSKIVSYCVWIMRLRRTMLEPIQYASPKNSVYDLILQRWWCFTYILSLAWRVNKHNNRIVWMESDGINSVNSALHRIELIAYKWEVRIMPMHSQLKTCMGLISWTINRFTTSISCYGITTSRLLPFLWSTEFHGQCQGLLSRDVQ